MLAHISFSSVTQLCLTLCDPMNRSTPGLPVHHQLLELAQTHVHRVGEGVGYQVMLCMENKKNEQGHWKRKDLKPVKIRGEI